MNHSLDINYLNRISSQLRNFKKVRNNVYNCSCPICGDSKKNTLKARGYFFEFQNTLVFKCHNCGLSISFSSFLKEINITLYNEYIFERYHNKDYSAKVEKENFIEVVKSIKNVDLPKISELDIKHYAVQYVINRRIPESEFSRIYFTEDWGSWANKTINEKYTKPNDHRLVLPFFDIDGNLVSAQGRSFSSSKEMRYVTAKQSNVLSCIFGLDKWNKFNNTYIVEGPIDSLFLDNCLAVASSDLLSIFTRFPLLNTQKCTFIYDNEPFSKEICSLMHKTICNGYSICIWPKEIKQKDINDMCLSGLTIKEISDIILSNTFNGLSAELQFSFWRKS